MDNNTKLYYDTNEVAELLGCQPSALRFWEKKFPHLCPKRDSRNRRRYTESDIEVIRKIMYQRETQGRSIKATRQQLNHREMAQNVIHRLTRIRSFLEEIRDSIH
ncbi:MerR family transcriptional regulator [Arundinibacter roseus]|uniref:MerR family transcriptional regulator n=1 Tax=Arundinibacter roseus TaxID=2070510 RepID=A0A4R4K9R2_9BACT|nr:MerR family transcriptional regulator [Arundinibacter roseus]TDB64577.1 MerR family transcriptional regulator [Arundinibacter roseus]